MVRADLAADAEALLTQEWLTGQRWYGAHDRHLAGIQLVDAADLPMPAGGPSAWLLVANATFALGAPIRYLIPVSVRPTDTLREPRDDEGAWRAIAMAIADGRVLNADSGSFRCEPAAAVAELVPDGPSAIDELAERRLGVEQSNTSVALGDRLILKIYRRLAAGENPELEVGAFLESVGCRVVPRIAGSLQYLAPDGTAAAAAMLQERVASRGDAWQQLGELLAGDDLGPDGAIAAVREIGEVTAKLHEGLAARPEDIAFPVRDAAPPEVESWLRGALTQLDQARYALGGDERSALDRLAPRIRQRIEAAFRSGEKGRVMRIHGDYHLGQLLVAPDGYRVIDFEGEPARPLAERRAPQPPERDVAGMLRSLDYAARSAERGRHVSGFSAETWLAHAREAFLAAYASSAPHPPVPALVTGFEIEKACYEVRYEAANRPAWTWLPLEALARLT